MPRLLPPALFVIMLLPLGLLWFLGPAGAIMRVDRPLPWDIPLAAGLFLLIAARFQFLRAKTEINTFRLPNRMVTDGVFRVSRNPMYLGFLLLLLAAAMYVNTWYALIVPGLFLLFANFWYIPHEERVMRQTFGPDYEDYEKSVRRWI